MANSTLWSLYWATHTEKAPMAGDELTASFNWTDKSAQSLKGCFSAHRSFVLQ